MHVRPPAVPRDRSGLAGCRVVSVALSRRSLRASGARLGPRERAFQAVGAARRRGRGGAAGTGLLAVRICYRPGVSRARVARPPVPSKEALRVEQRAHRRHRQRAEQRQKEQNTPPNGEQATSGRRARRRLLAKRRRLAAALPRPLRCHARASGAGAPSGVTGLRGALRKVGWGGGAFAAVLGILAVLVWAGAFGSDPWGAQAAALLGAVGAGALVRWLAGLALAAGARIPAEVSVEGGEIRIRWEGGATLAISLDAVARAEARGGAGAASGAGAVPPPKFNAKAPSTAVITLRDGGTISVETTVVAAAQLAAAIEVARGDLAGRRASRPRPRPAGEDRERGVVDRQSSEDAGTPPGAGAPAPNEAALAALDRDGRPIEAWKRALRAAFADGGYRKSPPLQPDDLLQIVGDARVPVERRVGAALALSERGDDDLRARLRIASDGLETEVLRVAVERAAEGTLEEDALEEAVAHEALAHERPARAR